VIRENAKNTGAGQKKSFGAIERQWFGEVTKWSRPTVNTGAQEKYPPLVERSVGGGVKGQKGSEVGGSCGSCLLNPLATFETGGRARGRTSSFYVDTRRDFDS